MTNILTILGILVFVGGGIWKNKPAITVGVLLIILGAFI